jgi:nucleotide-binding universal stress UspA family protein
MIALAHERASAELHGTGVTVEAGIIPGRPERAVLAEADRFEADLIVVGARGQGSVAATLLGSVSRAVVENASCSVLVARGTATRRVLLATDGSTPAKLATTIVATWPMFATARILLVAVGEPPPRYPRVVLGHAEWRSAFRDTLATSAERACDIVEQAVKDLAAPGREVEIEVRLGEIDTEITAAALAWSTDIVVLGSNGRPLLHRLFLGSVARKVLDGVASSVLVARPPVDISPTKD